MPRTQKTVLETDEYSVLIYSPDHEPPHVHVIARMKDPVLDEERQGKFKLQSPDTVKGVEGEASVMPYFKHKRGKEEAKSDLRRGLYQSEIDMITPWLNANIEALLQEWNELNPREAKPLQKGNGHTRMAPPAHEVPGVREDLREAGVSYRPFRKTGGDEKQEQRYRNDHRARNSGPSMGRR